MEKQLELAELADANGEPKAMASGIAVHCAHDEIVELVSLVPNPRNPNKHPDKQIALLGKMIKHQGWRAPIVVSNRSGFIVTGHGRFAAAKMLAVDSVPVNYQDFVDEATEYAHLIADNRIAEFAEMETTGLKSLLDDLAKWNVDMDLVGFTKADLRKLDRDAKKILNETEQAKPDELDKFGTLEGVKALKPDAQFPSKALYDIPELRADALMAVPANLKCWAGPDAVNVMEAPNWLYNWGTDSRRGLDMEKTLIAFYTEDYRFESFWYAPDDYVGRLLNARVLGSITPNFSLWIHYPMAVKIYNTYRSRWVGRYMQEAGVKIIPDICGFEHPDTQDLCLVGIPPNAPCLSVQIQTGVKSTEQIGFVRMGLKKIIEELVPQQLLIYCGETWEEIIDTKDFPKSLNLVLVQNRLQERTDVMKSANKTMNTMKGKL